MLGTFAGACRSRGRREAGGGDLNDGGRRQDGLDDDGDVDGVQDARNAEANRVGEMWSVDGVQNKFECAVEAANELSRSPTDLTS